MRRYRGRARGVSVFLLALAATVAQPILAIQSGPAIPAAPDDRAIVHVLNRLGFGPAPGDVDRVRKAGLRAYIEEQLRPDRIEDASLAARLGAFTTLGRSSREIAEEYFVPAQLARREQQRRRAALDTAMAGEQADARQMLPAGTMEAIRGDRMVLAELAQQKILRAVYSERQLQEVMVDFWFNHFNVFAGKGPVRVYLHEYEREAIRPHALGGFRDLLQATAESPAMLFYLDNWQSAAAPDADTMASRELRQRRPAGRFPARRPRPATPAASAQAAQNRRPRGLNENYARELMELHTMGADGGYTQKDVQEVARAFTGWTISGPRQGGGFRFEPRMHDDGEKVVLGHRIPAGGGKGDGERVLDILAQHPSTARFIASKLARRFVADDPPAALVDRAAARFRQTGGDIREVVRTIVTSREFFDADRYGAKVKTPLEFVVSAVRATGADAATALPLVQALRDLGMPPYGCQPPTGYADRADAWVNTGALLNRMNFAVALAAGRLHGVRVAPSLSQLLPEAARDALATQVAAGRLSPATAATVAKAGTTAQALALVLGSPEFQRR